MVLFGLLKFNYTIVQSVKYPNEKNSEKKLLSTVGLHKVFANQIQNMKKNVFPRY